MWSRMPRYACGCVGVGVYNRLICTVCVTAELPSHIRRYAGAVDRLSCAISSCNAKMCVCVVVHVKVACVRGWVVSGG